MGEAEAGAGVKAGEEGEVADEADGAEGEEGRRKRTGWMFR